MDKPSTSRAEPALETAPVKGDAVWFDTPLLTGDTRRG
jgi:hypothetical protein